MISLDDLLNDPTVWEAPREALAVLIDAGRMLDVSTTRDINAKFGEDLGFLLLQSAKLHLKARRKFGEGHWWVTERSLQQATPRIVAKLKASWMPILEIESDSVADHCCGIGGDAMEISLRHRVNLIDQDPLVLAAAVANIHQVNGQVASASCEVAQSHNQNDSLWHIDPDRRSSMAGGSVLGGSMPGAGEKRTTHLETMLPPWSWITDRLASFPDAMIKLAPATLLTTDDLPSGLPWHRAWISTSAGVAEQTVLTGRMVSGPTMQPREHSAWIVRQDQPVRVFAGRPSEQTDPTDKIGDYLFDPDPAIRAAGLTATVAERFRFRTLAGPMGFLTGDQAPPGSLADDPIPGTFGRVIWSGTMDDRKLRREFRRLDAFAQVVKARGVDSNTSALEKRYRDLGSRPVTLWLGRRGKSRFAAMTGE